MKDKAADPTVDLQSISWTPETCWSACAVQLGNPLTFVYNIYYNETMGAQVRTESV